MEKRAIQFLVRDVHVLLLYFQDVYLCANLFGNELGEELK